MCVCCVKERKKIKQGKKINKRRNKEVRKSLTWENMDDIYDINKVLRIGWSTMLVDGVMILIMMMMMDVKLINKIEFN